MPERERVTKVFEDLGFGGRGVRAVVAIRRDRETQHRLERSVVVDGDVLDLLREGADTLELAVGRRKRVLVLGHRFRRR